MKKPLSIKKCKDKVWTQFSKYIRLKYADKYGYERCYTCGVRKHWKEMQCGHGFGGRGGAILFDEEVCRPQCYSCNIIRGGNYDVFHVKLENEYGYGFLQKKLKQKTQTRKYNRKELEEMYQKYKAIVETYTKLL